MLNIFRIPHGGDEARRGLKNLPGGKVVGIDVFHNGIGAFCDIFNQSPRSRLRRDCEAAEDRCI